MISILTYVGIDLEKHPAEMAPRRVQVDFFCFPSCVFIHVQQIAIDTSKSIIDLYTLFEEWNKITDLYHEDKR